MNRFKAPSPGRPRQPDSLMTRALVELSTAPEELDSTLMNRALGNVCATAEQVAALRGEMKKLGLFKRVVILTDKGKAAIEAAKRAREQA